MKRISPAWGLVTAAVIVLAVSSCAPAVHPSSAPTGRPHPTVKPHPHATQGAIPSVRVPVKCASLFTDTTASSLIDASVTNHRDETTVPIDVTNVAERQYGSLDCLWGAEPQDSGFVFSLSVDITPDAASGFDNNLAAFASFNPPVVDNTAGDKSVYGCAGGGGLSCVGNMLVGSYWVTANLQDIETSTVSSTAASARMQQVLSTVAAAIKNTKPSVAWNPPAGALPTFCSASGSTAQVNAAVGESDLQPVGTDEAGSDAASYTQVPTDYTQCGWQAHGASDAFTGVNVAMLRGGAWVLPGLPGNRDPLEYMLDKYQPMTIPGTTAAAGVCSVPVDFCVVDVSIGSLLAVIYIDDPNDTQAMAAIAKIVADIKSS